MPVENEELLEQFPAEFYTDDHLFLVENVRTPKDQRLPHLICGNAVKGKIIDGHYDIEYVGPNSTSKKNLIAEQAQQARVAAGKLLDARPDEIKTHPQVRLNGSQSYVINQDTQAEAKALLADAQAQAAQIIADAEAKAKAHNDAVAAAQGQVQQMLADGQDAVAKMLADAQAQFQASLDASKPAAKGKGKTAGDAGTTGDGGTETDPPAA